MRWQPRSVDLQQVRAQPLLLSEWKSGNEEY